MKTYNVAIIGCGQLGSRHLQALAKIDRAISVYVVDPSESALITAQKRFADTENYGNVESVNYFTQIDSVPSIIDVAIIATNSLHRREIIERLAKHTQVANFILEKVLFPRMEDYESIGTLLTTIGAKAWVNCPRRMLSFYQMLREKLQGALFYEYRVSGSQWGLGCNAIHMLDLFAYLSGHSAVEFQTELLDSNYANSKRAGYIEFTGTLYGKTSNGATIILSSYPEGETPLMIEIVSDCLRCVVSEAQGKAWMAEKRTGWKWNQMDFCVAYQSQLTHLVVQSILEARACDLTSYEESSVLHMQIIGAFLQHMRKSGEEVIICPIT